MADGMAADDDDIKDEHLTRTESVVQRLPPKICDQQVMTNWSSVVHRRRVKVMVRKLHSTVRVRMGDQFAVVSKGRARSEWRRRRRGCQGMRRQREQVRGLVRSFA